MNDGAVARSRERVSDTRFARPRRRRPLADARRRTTKLTTNSGAIMRARTPGGRHTS